VEILFIFPLKIKRLKRIAGLMPIKKPNLSAQTQKLKTHKELNEIPQINTLPKPVDACFDAITFSIWFFELSKHSFGA